MRLSHWGPLGGALTMLIHTPFASASALGGHFEWERSHAHRVVSMADEEGQACTIALGMPGDDAVSAEAGQTFTWQGAACSNARYTFEFTPLDAERETIVIENVRSPLTFGSEGPGGGDALPSWAVMAGDSPAAEWRITAEGSSSTAASPVRCLNLQGDLDGDGVLPCEGDCDNRDPHINPDAPEVPYDGIDQDCDGEDLIDVDQDGDPAEYAGGSDCDDLDPTVSASADEIPYDGIDQDCDGDDLNDVDGDGEAALEAGGADCDDLDAGVFPGAYDIPDDGIDQDCDGIDAASDDYSEDDLDGDGYSPAAGDCDDTDSSVNPGAYDGEGDGIDANCDGVDGYLVYPDEDSDGWSWYDGDCNDADASTYPGAYDYPGDGYDADCDGMD